jgi:dephospho-CoA kinase
MFLVGLTGGIGAGKSSAAQFLAGCGFPVVDTDVLAREVVQPGQPALAEVVGTFGKDLLNQDGTLNRARLAELVFSNATARTRLERILHPRIRSSWQATVQQWRDSAQQLGVVVIPLLFEISAQSAFDSVACVACTAGTQHTRLRQRRWTDAQISGRLAAQWSMERKMAAANVVIWTEGEMSVHEAQWKRVLARWLPGSAAL